LSGTTQSGFDHRFTIKILIGLVLGILIGLFLKWQPVGTFRTFMADDVLNTLGQIFINLIKMLVVPIVFVSLVCGCSALGDVNSFGRLGIKTVLLYLFTTAVAIILAIVVAKLFAVGSQVNLHSPTQFVAEQVPSIKQTLINIVPINPFAALVTGNMLQIIFFAIMLGTILPLCGEPGQYFIRFFTAANEVVMRLITAIIKTAPYGVFCLLGALFAKLGYHIILELVGYFFTVLLVLFIQLVVVYGSLLSFIARVNPVRFFRKMYSAMLFAFSVSSSNASIPIVLKTVEEKLGVKNKVASFIIPLGSTINMDGTAIMQGVATVFIANAYHVAIGVTGYATVVMMATLASIGTAGVPGVGLITLAMVLQQVGLPVEGIAFIIGVDRLLDMARTAVNISGDSTIALLVGKSEKAFDSAVFQEPT